MENKVELNLTDIVSFLRKPRASFTKADIKRFIKAQNIRHVNFMYAGGDGRLKTLNFIIRDAHTVAVDWRVRYSGIVYHVNAINHNRQRGMKTLYCTKVNE